MHPKNLVGCFGLNGPLRQYFSLYRAVHPKDADGMANGIDPDQTASSEAPKPKKKKILQRTLE